MPERVTGMDAEFAPSFDLRLYNDDDDDRDLAIKQILEPIINGSRRYSEATVELTTYISSKAEKKWLEVKDKKPEDIEDAWNDGPNPLVDVSFTMGYIASVCSAYPPKHIVHDFLIEFIKALVALPDQNLHRYAHDYEDEDTQFPIVSQIWKSYRIISEAFYDEAKELNWEYSDVETMGSETQLRWRNFQSFIARLIDVVGCYSSCALHNILPSSLCYPDLKERVQGGPRRIAGELIAGAYWLETDEACSLFYEHCKEGGQDEDDSCGVWSLKGWDELKSQMVFIAEELKFGPDDLELAEEMRGLAISLKTRMDGQN